MTNLREARCLIRDATVSALTTETTQSIIMLILYSLFSKMIASLRLRNRLQDGWGSRCNSRYYRPLNFYLRIHNEVIIQERREYYILIIII